MQRSLIITIVILAVTGLALTGCCGFGGRAIEDIAEELESSGTADFAGTYQVAGEGYKAVLTITKTGDGYHLEWNLPDGSTHYGKGIVVDDVLGAFFSTSDGSNAGVVAYKKDAKGVTGLWTVAGGEQLSSEKTSGSATLRRGSADLEGEYTVSGTNPGPGSYRGDLSVLKSGEAWSARWLTGGEIYGTGLDVDGVLVLGYGDAAGAGVAVYRIRGDDLHGYWLYATYAEMSAKTSVNTGTEKAKRTGDVE